MASYCTRADLEARVGATELVRLADLDMDGAEDLTAVAEAIADVDAYISSRIATHWPAYVGVATAALCAIAVDLAVDKLARGSMSTEEIRRRGDRARADLAAIGRGDAVPDPLEAGPFAGGEVCFVPGRRVFPGGGY